ncbi:MAG: sporulation protein [Ruminococcus sp.]|nr:sporulation protein [Ruminococcus sp.]
MNMRKPLKCTAAVISAVLVCTGSAFITTAETTLSGSEEEALVSSIAETAGQPVSEDEIAEAEWWKAEITDYDSSLSLISYELTPERTQTEDEETEETDEEEDENAEESEDEESEEESADDEEASDESVSEENSDSTSPTPVESQTGGGTVSELPQAQERPSVNAKSGEFAFTTYGWGHGVGMSQNGANFYASYSGWSYQDILYHYYPGTYLMNTGTAGSEQVVVNGASGDTLSMVAGIVYREVGSSMNVEAIKAQAVAVYTYIKYYGDNARDLRCKANPPQNVIDACASVLGEALYYNGDFAMTMFYASSGGASANCYEVFTNDIPYLRSVPSEYDSAYDPHYGSVKYLTSSEVKRLVEARYGITLSSNPANWFQIVEGGGGYVSEVVIDGQKTVRGVDLKNCLGLKSSNYDVTFTS